MDVVSTLEMNETDMAGLGLGALFERFGKPIQAGNNLIIDTLHDEGPEVPLRMAPKGVIGLG